MEERVPKMTGAMVSHVLERIPFELDLPALYAHVRVKPGSELVEELLPLAEEALRIARPKAVYFAAYVTDRGDDFVEIEGVRFTSRVLRVNLDKAFRVFPHLATCGLELHMWGRALEDPLHRYWAETLQQHALAAARQALSRHIAEMYDPGETSAMNPGSLAEWPIEQQQMLFSLFGGNAEHIGVRLTGSMLMVPAKTVSGIRFPTTERFESCQLCPRDNCPGRRAPFEPVLYSTKYGVPAP